MFTKLGNHISTQKGFAFKSDWYRQQGVPIVKVSDFTADSVDTSELTYIANEIAVDLQRYRLNTGDVVIQTVGSWPNNPKSVVGKAIKIQANVNGALLNQNAVRLDPKDDLDKTYLFYVLRNESFKSYIVGCAQGAASQASITLEAIREYSFELPPLPVQRKIADVLSAYDDLIEVNTRRIRILEQMAQSVYREWFGKMNVKSLPDGWEITKLSNLVETQYGYTESASDVEVGPKFVRGMDINKNSYIQWDEVPYCPIKTDELPKFKLSVGDIMVIRMADPGKVGIVEKDVDAVFASYLIRLRIKSPKLSPYFLFYYLLSDHYQNYVIGASTGTTRKSASAGVITDVDVVVPPAEIRQKFENDVSALRLLLNNLLNQNANLRRTRDLLLPRLVSGEVRVDGSKLEI